MNQTSEVEIRLAMGEALENYEVFHNQILLGIFMRGTIRLVKGDDGREHKLWVSDGAAKEDQYQGKVGVVLKIGPLAFRNDARNDFAEQSVKVGDWLVYRINDGFSLDINKVHCRMIEDVHVRGRVADPSTIW